MERYFVKAPVSGWHEVDGEHFKRFVENIRKNANPPTMTKGDIIKSRTKIITTGPGNRPSKLNLYKITHRIYTDYTTGGNTMNTYYDYEELVAKAMAADATQEDINALGAWFEEHGNCYWNGESFEIDSYNHLYPVYQEVEEDEFELTGYEIH